MRARNIKPGFFRNEQLMQVAPLGRLLFAGLWCLADREGRLYDRPRQIKWDILPADDCDVDALLADLARRGFIRRYTVDGIGYIEVVNFLRHQRPHYKETASILPPPTISPTQISEQHRLIPDTRYSDTVSSDNGFSDIGCPSAGRTVTGYCDADYPDVDRSIAGYCDAGCSDADRSSAPCTDNAPSPNGNMPDGNTNYAKSTNLPSKNHTANPANAGKTHARYEAGYRNAGKADTAQLTAPHTTDIPAYTEASKTEARYDASSANASKTDTRYDAGYRNAGKTDTVGMTVPHMTDIPALVSRLLALWHTLSTHHTTADRHYIESALQQGHSEATLSALFHAKHAEYHTARSKKNFTLSNLLGKKLPHHLANLPAPTHTASAMPTTPAPPTQTVPTQTAPTHTAPATPSKTAPTTLSKTVPTQIAPATPSKTAPTQTTPNTPTTPTQTAPTKPSKTAPTHTALVKPSKTAKHTLRWTEAFFAE